MESEYIKLASDIKKGAIVSSEIRNQYFSGWKFGQIRNWLEANGLDRHTCIELNSTEVAIITPKGILMQVRSTDTTDVFGHKIPYLGMWGGVMEDGENPIEGAVREVKEETGLDILADQFVIVEENTHDHQYDNGDKARFHTWRLRVVIDYVPEISTDNESLGSHFVMPILQHQVDFIERMMRGGVK